MNTTLRSLMVSGLAVLGSSVLVAVPTASASTGDARDARVSDDAVSGEGAGGAASLLATGDGCGCEGPGEDPATDVFGKVGALASVFTGAGRSFEKADGVLTDVPLTLAETAVAVATGSLTQADAIDRLRSRLAPLPLDVLDPTFVPLISLLPAPIGGEEGQIRAVRNQIGDLSYAVANQFASIAAGLPDVLSALPTAMFAPLAPVAGVVLAGGRSVELADTFLTDPPLTTAETAIGIVTGAVNPASVPNRIVDYVVNRPASVLDPTFAALRGLPAPIGGDEGPAASIQNQLHTVASGIVGRVPAPAADDCEPGTDQPIGTASTLAAKTSADTGAKKQSTRIDSTTDGNKVTPGKVTSGGDSTGTGSGSGAGSSPASSDQGATTSTSDSAGSGAAGGNASSGAAS